MLVCYWPGREDIALELRLSTVPFSIPTCWCCTVIHACVFSASAKLPTSHTDLYRIGRSVTYFSVKLGCLFYQGSILHLVGLTTGDLSSRKSDICLQKSAQFPKLLFSKMYFFSPECPHFLKTPRV